MTDCPRFGKWIGGCRFEPRYSSFPASITPEQIDAMKDALIFSSDVLEAIKALANAGEIYVHDVCIRCGKSTKP